MPADSNAPDQNSDTESDSRFSSGEWNGFYIESHRSGRGWMSMYLAFANGSINGEGTDYVGPWVAKGSYDTDSGMCSWTKQYLGLHAVHYSGRASNDGIQGQWNIGSTRGDFHIWPRGLSQFDELYLKKDLDLPEKSLSGTFEDSFSETSELEPQIA